MKIPRQLSTGIATVLALLLLAGPTTGQAAGVRLLRVGNFHGKDVSARSGERWFALTGEQNQSRLTGVELVVEQVHDPVLDGRNGTAETGKKVSVPGTLQNVLVLVAGSNLEEGEVDTAYAALHGRYLLAPGAVKWRLSSGREYTFSSRAASGGKRDVLLSSAGRSQVLLTRKAVGGRMGETERLLWSGDLDRDGQLDLLLDLSDHYNVQEWTLYLSSSARKGELVRKVATFRTMGC